MNNISFPSSYPYHFNYDVEEDIVMLPKIYIFGAFLVILSYALLSL